ncbi:MAG TPA: peptide chain release factor N(5)-glutamine methyltransferase [Bacteroidota bacterium]
MIQQKVRVWTIRELMKFAIDHLEKLGFGETRLTVELLLSHALGCQRIQLYTSFDKPLTKEELARFRALYERRLVHEPVQYIVGSTNFMGLHLRVNPAVLIPRPETETLVEQAMLECKEFENDENVSVIELGAGSGNISIAIAKFVRNASIVSIDSSAEAIELAKENAVEHKVDARIEFKLMDMFEPVDQLLLKRFDILVSNPPYISKEDWEGLATEIKRYEPQTALTDFKDGYEFHERIIELSPYLLRNGGTVLFEVGYGQSREVSEAMRKAGYADVSTIPDLQGIQRVVRGRCRSNARGIVNVN